MTRLSKCLLCKQNQGENEKFGFMWHCKPLGYCVPFGWHRCEAQHKGKGNFELIEEHNPLTSKGMKTTDVFQSTIKAYLDQRAEEDKLFTVAYAKEGKNIKDCCTYILNQVKASGCNGFADDEVYSMALHYYDEDNIEVGKPINGRVAVNHSIELTEAEKLKAKKEAIRKYQTELAESMRPEKAVSAPKPKRQTEELPLPSLFNFDEE